MTETTAQAELRAKVRDEVERAVNRSADQTWMERTAIDEAVDALMEVVAEERRQAIEPWRVAIEAHAAFIGYEANVPELVDQAYALLWSAKRSDAPAEVSQTVMLLHRVDCLVPLLGAADVGKEARRELELLRGVLRAQLALEARGDD